MKVIDKGIVFSGRENTDRQGNSMTGIIVNEDNSHFFGSRPVEKMNEAGLRELVDNYCGKQVVQINFCPNCMRVNYDSKVWDSCWGPNKGILPECLQNKAQAGTFEGWVDRWSQWIINAKKLHDAGINPYQFWMKYSREKKISPWISMRMNDVHSAGDPDNWIHSEFWRDNPQFHRVHYRNWTWFDRALDYGREEVRQRALKLIAEYLKLFDMDGLELDWMRFPFHFKPGFEAEGGRLLTEFHQQVREMVDDAEKRWGHEIKIGVRVLSDPENAAGMGLDAVQWAKLGLVDLVVPTPFLWQDFDMPITQWRRLLGDKVQLAAGLELSVGAYPNAKSIFSDIGIASANAVNYLSQGADNLYLFNHMDSETAMHDPDEFAKVLDTDGWLESAMINPRRHVVTYTDTVAIGKATKVLLPAECKKDQISFCGRLPLGMIGNVSNAQVILGFAEDIITSDLTVRVNGSICEPCEDKLNNGISPSAKTKQAFAISVSMMHDGYNVLEVFNESQKLFTIVWAEIILLPGREN